MDPNRLLSEAVTLHAAGQLEPAEALYRELLSADPVNVRALTNLGTVRLQRGDSVEGMRLLEAALQLDPLQIDAAFNRALALQGLGRPEEALVGFDQVMALRPDRPDVHYARGLALETLGRPAEALAAYDRVLAVMPTAAEVHQQRGNALFALQRHAEALASYDRSLSLQPGCAGTLNNRGIALYSLGRFAEALASYDRALALKPDYADAHNNRGNALSELRRHTEALESYDRALALKPDDPLSYNNRGAALFALTRYAEALESYDRALALKPDYAEACKNRGNSLRALHRHAEALESYDRALALKPDYADAYTNRGSALAELNRHTEALQSYDRALALKPDDALSHNNRGTALFALTRYAEALESYDRALALKPDYADAYTNRGSALAELRRHTEALESFDRALSIKPDSAEAYNSRGLALYALGRFAEALASYDRALQLNPGFAETHGNLGNAFLHRGEIAEAIAEFRRALELKPDFALIHSNLLFALHYTADVDAEDMFEEHRRWDELHGEPLRKEQQPHANHPDPGRRLRIGYVSPDFRQHSVAFFLDDLLTHHNRGEVDVFCYANVRAPDAVTARLRKQAEHWRDITGLGDAEAAALIRRDGIDILVDLAGHTGGNRLLVFARRPAPVQVTYLGYCDTTGLRAIDYRLTDAFADPPGTSECLNTEQLVRLPEGAWCFRPLEEAPQVIAPPVLQSGRITFGSFNALPKLSDPVLRLWSGVMRQLPGSRLLLKSVGLGEPSVQRRLQARLHAAGIPPGRVQMVDRSPTYVEHLARYGQVDIALDTCPYHGTTTTCEALWMGVPVVTLAGRTHAARVGISLLTAVGLPELVAAEPQDYVRIAVALSGDASRLAQLRRTLRARMAGSTLMDGARFARQVEQAYRWMWRNWCTDQTPPPAS